jgi:hypothetical protein
MTTVNVSTEEKKATKTPRKRTTRSSTEKSNEVSLDLPNNPFVFEILSLINKVDTKERRIEILKKYEHPCLKTIFIWNFDDNVISMLPEGDVPYSTVGEDLVKTGTVSDHIQKEVEKMEFYDNPSVGYTEKIRTGHTSLRTEYEKLINFVKSRSGAPGNANLTSLRRESMFIEMLQGLHPLDAEIMCLVKDKKLQTKYNVTKIEVSEAYSDIIWEQNR